jgi:hypothetical protein
MCWVRGAVIIHLHTGVCHLTSLTSPWWLCVSAAYEADNDADIIRKDTPDEFVADLRREICKWSSNQFR